MIARFLAFLIASSIFQVSLIAQSHLPPLPSNTQVVVHIDNTDGLVNELKHYRTLVSESQFQKILLDDPFPLLKRGQWDQFLDSFDQLIGLLEQTQSITFFASSLESEIEYGIWWKLDQPDSVQHFLQTLASLRKDSPLWESYQLDLSKTAKKQPDEGNVSQESPFDLGLKIMGWSAAFRPVHFETIDQSIVISNSNKLASWMKDGTKREAKTLETSRRFRRAVSGLTKEPFDAFVYLIPQFALPIWDPKMDSGFLKKHGYDEMVGTAAGIRFWDPDKHPDQAIARLSLSVPFTVPATGVVRNWQCYSPIESVPELSDYLNSLQNEKPKLLRLISKNRAESFRLTEEFYRQNDELEQWDKLLDPYVKYAGSRQIFRDFYSGEEVILRLTSDKPKPHSYLLHFHRIKDEQVTRSYIGHYLKYFNQNNDTPKQLMKLSGYDSWFQSDKNALRQAKSDFGNKVDESQRHLIRNSGYTIANDWLIQSDKWIVENYLENYDAGNRNFAQEFDKCFLGLKRIVSDYKPEWIEFRFSNSRQEEVVQQLRMRYFLTQMDKKNARELVIGWRKSISHRKTIPIKSRSDRLFAVSDWVVFQFFGRYERDVRFFRCRDSSFEWHWQFFGSGNIE